MSTQEQADKGWNLGEDKRLIKERCQREGWDLIEVYDDGGRQGDDPDRPGLIALVNRLPEIDVVVMRAQDRISRDLGIWVAVSTALRAAGVRLETFTGPIELESASGEFMADVMASVGKFEKRRTGERVKQAAEARARAGRHHGRAPYGYRSEDGKLVIVPAAAVVRRIFRECAAEGLSQRETSRRLNRDGIRGQRGDWTQGTVSKLLRSPVYAGKLTFHGEVLDGIHEPIIDLDLWTKAEQLREANTRTRKGRTPTANHLLAGGTLRCGRCGAAMYATTRPQRGKGVAWEAYTCSTRQRQGLDACDQPPVKRQPIDEAIWRFVTETVLDLDATRATILEQINAKLAEITALTDQAHSDAAKAQERLLRIRRDYADGKLDSADWLSFRDEYTTEHEAACAAAKRLDDQHLALTVDCEQIDTESVVLAELTAIRAEILGQAREGEHAGVQAFRTALRRLFVCFELVPVGSFGVDRETDGVMWPQDEDLSLRVPGYQLWSYVLPEGLNWDPGSPWAIRRVPLPLRGSDDKTLTR